MLYSARDLCGEPEKITGAAVFLDSPASKDITGTASPVNGGSTAF